MGALDLIRKLSPALREKYYAIASEFADKLPVRDRDVLRNLVDQESATHSSIVNTALRNDSAKQDNELLRYIDNILKKSPRADQDFVLYRGAPMEQRPHREPGYLFSTSDKAVAKGYADDYNEMLDYPEDFYFTPTIPGRASAKELVLGPRTPLVNPDVSGSWGASEFLLPRGMLLHPEPGMQDVYRTKLPTGFKKGGLTMVKSSCR